MNKNSSELSKEIKFKNSASKTSRTRAREHAENLVPRFKNKTDASYNEKDKCNIEIIPSNEEFEEHIIEIKKEHEVQEIIDIKEEQLHDYNSHLLLERGRGLCNTYLKPKLEKEISLSNAILISEFHSSSSPKNGKKHKKNQDEHSCINRRIFDNGADVDKTDCKFSEIGDSNFDLKLNFENVSSDQKLVQRLQVDPEQFQWIEKLKIPKRCQFPQRYIVDDFEEVKEILAMYEHETFTRLLVSDVNSKFRLKNTQYCGETVHFREKGKKDIPFQGTPFAKVGRLTFRCHQGSHLKRTDKEVKRDQKLGPDRKRYRKFMSTKKKNCPLKVTVMKVVVFPEYSVDVSNEPRSKLYKISSFIKKNKEKMKFLVKYIFTLPSVLDHKKHQLGDESVSREAVDKRVFDKVEEYVKAGITKAPHVKELLHKFIQVELRLDETQWKRRKYNPSLKDIRGKIYRTLSDMKAKVKTEAREKKTPTKRKTESPGRLEEKEDPRTGQVLSLFEQDNRQNNELIIYEPGLGENVTVDLSEGNVHHEEMITIASIIDVQPVADEEDLDSNRKLSIDNDLSKLNLLSVLLRGESLDELRTDLNALVSKWRPVLEVACQTKSNSPKGRTKSVKGLTNDNNLLQEPTKNQFNSSSITKS